jgi:hypothetical protein
LSIERSNWEVQAAGRITFRWILMKDGRVWTRIHVAQDRDQWQAVLIAVMNLLFS